MCASFGLLLLLQLHYAADAIAMLRKPAADAGAVWVGLAVSGLQGGSARALRVSDVGVDAKNENEGNGKKGRKKFGHGGLLGNISASSVRLCVSFYVTRFERNAVSQSRVSPSVVPFHGLCDDSFGACRGDA